MTFDLGFIKAISSGPTPPVNGEMLWYDTNVHLHKYYDVGSTSWISLASGASSWSVVLSSGAATLGQKPIISPGDGLLFEDGGFQILLETGTLSANRTIQFQDGSGILAFLSDVSAAGDLNSILNLGNSTGGVDIELTSGDRIRSSVGSAYIDLRDGSNGSALLYGGSRAKVFSPTQVSLESTVLLTMKTTAGQTNAITDIGFGFNTGSPSSRMHLEVPYSVWAASGNADIFKITNSTNMQIQFGLATTGLKNFGFLQSYGTGNGWIALQPDKGYSISVGMDIINPQLGDTQILLGIGNPNEIIASDHIVGIYSTTSRGSYYKTYHGSSGEVTTSIGHDNSQQTLIENYLSGRDMLLKVTQTSSPQTVAKLRANELSFEISRELCLGPEPFLPIGIPHPGGILAANRVNGQTIALLAYSTPGTFIGMNGYYQGRVLTLMNVTGNNITLQNNNITAGNAQFIISTGDIVLGIRESATFYYRQNALGTGQGAWIAISSFN